MCAEFRDVGEQRGECDGRVLHLDCGGGYINLHMTKCHVTTHTYCAMTIS